MKNCFLKSIFVIVFSFTIMLPTAQATLITSLLGNDAPTLFGDGDTPGVLDVNTEASGNPAPFDFGIGIDSDVGPNFSATWTHAFGTITDTILSATYSIGIIDHDSASAGSQLLSFDLGGTSFQATLDALFEGSGGLNNEYNVYSFTIPSTFYATLATGSVLADLQLQGSVESPGFLPIFPSVTHQFNGARLLHSKIVIETQASGGGTTIPEPNTIFLFLGGSILLAIRNYFAKKI